MKLHPCPYNRTDDEHILNEDPTPSINQPKSTRYSCRCGVVVVIPHVVIRGSTPARLEARLSS